MVSSVPVDWDYRGVTFNGFSGMTGVAQDPEDGTIEPVVGWFVTHILPKSKWRRLEDVRKEIQAMLLGHKTKTGAKVVADTWPWHVRLETLRGEQTSLEKYLSDEETVELAGSLTPAHG